MFFPVAGIEVNPLLPPLVALGVSYFCSMAGVSGGFLLLPFQVSVLGYGSPSVSATNQFFNIVATPGGIYRYLREGRMLWPLALVTLLGTFPGVFIGALARVTFLTDLAKFKLFVALVLLYMGYRVLRGLIGARGRSSGAAQNAARQSSSEDGFRAAVSARSPRHSPSSISASSGQHGSNSPAKPGSCCGQSGGEANTDAAGQARQPADRGLLTVSNARASLKSISYDFGGSSFSLPTRSVFLLSFVVGVVGGVYGVGGGALLTPILVSFYSLPIYTVTASSLLATFGTSVFGVLFFLLLAPFLPEQNIAPDFALGLLFGLGGLAGMYLGARSQKFVPASYIKLGMALIIFATAVKYSLDFIASL